MTPVLVADPASAGRDAGPAFSELLKVLWVLEEPQNVLVCLSRKGQGRGGEALTGLQARRFAPSSLVSARVSLPAHLPQADQGLVKS
ncbi:hypothetical protein [Roseibium album]|uniref:hypothetical protein n=1 Tax=Roseibium album TaxID=311410 RepID=UPI00391D0033